MNLSKQTGETDHEYILRICTLRTTLDLSWKDVAKIINSELNRNTSWDAYRKYYSRHSGLDNNIDFDNGIFTDRTFEAKKNSYKLADSRTQINSLLRTISREETLKEIALEFVDEIAQQKPLNIKTIHNTTSTFGDEKIGSLLISDWHYGLDVNLAYNYYTPEVTKSRVTKLLVDTIDICTNNNVETLFVLNLGDMISGRIHLPLRLNSRMDVISQTMSVAEILAEFLVELSNYIPKIKYLSVTDNHSRLEPNKKESLQIESFVRIIDWYLKERLKNISNIEFIQNEISEDIATYEIFDKKVIAVHGDKDKPKNIIQNLSMYTNEHFDMVFSAHNHHFIADENSGTEYFSNGSLIGSDDYAASLRLNSIPSQLLVLSTRDNITKCLYKIKV